MTISELEARREELLKKMADISLEIKRIDAQLMEERARVRAPLFGKKVTAKNSLKTLFRGIVVEALRGTPYLRAEKLYEITVFYAGIMNDNTFRSHIHRMKEDGIIEKDARGYWKLTDKFKQSDIFQ